MMDFEKLTQEMWHVYFSDLDKDGHHPIENWIAPGCTVIGTGKHELYQTSEEFRAAIYQELAGRDNIQFQFRDFWCQPVVLSEDICLVYGEIYIYWESEYKEVTIDMDSRFTILYQRGEDGWKMIHIHHSLPNLEQASGEYYPKTLLKQFHEKMEQVEYLQTLAERDGLTSLINYRTFQEHYKPYVDTHTFCWLFLVDVDKFKEVNDTFGHMVGNHVLKKIAATLKNIVQPSDIVCRMGGDEFILLCSGLKTEADALAFVQAIKSAVLDAGKGEKGWTGISVGKARASVCKELEAVIGVADQNLYQDKKNRHQI